MNNELVGVEVGEGFKQGIEEFNTAGGVDVDGLDGKTGG